MKLTCTLVRKPIGTWLVRHTSSTFGTVEVSGLSREKA